MQTNAAAERNKNNGPKFRRISPVGEEKVYRRKDLLKCQVLSSEWKTESVSGYESGDSEDDKLPCVTCVTGENEGDCIWQTPSDHNTYPTPVLSILRDSKRTPRFPLSRKNGVGLHYPVCGMYYLVICWPTSVTILKHYTHEH